MRRAILAILLLLVSAPVHADPLGAELLRIYQERCGEEVRGLSKELRDEEELMLRQLTEARAAGRPIARLSATLCQEKSAKLTEAYLRLVSSPRKFNKWSKERELPKTFRVTASALSGLGRIEALRALLLPVLVPAPDAEDDKPPRKALPALPLQAGDQRLDLGWSNPEGDAEAWRQLKSDATLHDLILLHSWFARERPKVEADTHWLKEECGLELVTKWAKAAGAKLSLLHGQYEYQGLAPPDPSGAANRVLSALEVLSIKPGQPPGEFAQCWRQRDRWLQEWLIFLGFAAGRSEEAREWFRATARFSPAFTALQPDFGTGKVMELRPGWKQMERPIAEAKVSEAIYWGQLRSVLPDLKQQAPDRVWSGLIPPDLMKPPPKTNPAEVHTTDVSPKREPRAAIPPEDAWAKVCEEIKGADGGTTKVRVQQLRFQRLAFCDTELVALSKEGTPPNQRTGELRVVSVDRTTGEVKLEWKVDGGKTERISLTIDTKKSWPAWFFADAWDRRSWPAAGLAAASFCALVVVLWRRKDLRWPWIVVAVRKTEKQRQRRKDSPWPWIVGAVAGLAAMVLTLCVGPEAKLEKQRTARLNIDLPADGGISQPQWQQQVDVCLASLNAVCSKHQDDGPMALTFRQALRELAFCDTPKRRLPAAGASYRVRCYAWPQSVEFEGRLSGASLGKLEPKLRAVNLAGECVWPPSITPLPGTPTALTLMLTDADHGQFDPPANLTGAIGKPVAIGVRLPYPTRDSRAKAGLSTAERDGYVKRVSGDLVHDEKKGAEEGAGTAPLVLEAWLAGHWANHQLDKAGIVKLVKDHWEASETEDSRPVLESRLHWAVMVLLGLALLGLLVRRFLGTRMRWSLRAAIRAAMAIVGLGVLTLVLASLCSGLQGLTWSYGSPLTMGGRWGWGSLAVIGATWFLAAAGLQLLEWLYGQLGPVVYEMENSTERPFWRWRQTPLAGAFVLVALAILLLLSAPVAKIDPGAAANSLPAWFTWFLPVYAAALWTAAALWLGAVALFAWSCPKPPPTPEP